MIIRSPTGAGAAHCHLIEQLIEQHNTKVKRLQLFRHS